MKKKFVSEYDIETSTSFSISVKKKLLGKKTKYNKIEVYQSERLGNVLMLNNCFMFTEKDHHFYHDKCDELIMKKNNVKNILIVGGGDFGLVKKFSNWKNIKSITIVEIDKEVTLVCKKYFPKFFKINQSLIKKIELCYADGYEWVKRNSNRKFDLIIVDCTDPVGSAKKLFTKKFYKYVFNILNTNGLYIQQSGSPIIHNKKLIEPMTRCLKLIGFKKITVNPFPMPSYPLGTWSFIKSERRSN